MKFGPLELFETPLVERKGIALVNSSSSWASNEKDLESLYNSNYVAAITTRTAVVTENDAGSGKWQSVFEERSVHNHAFLKDSLPTIEGGRLTIARGSINSYGYSPHPLAQYMQWIAALHRKADSPEQRKPFIISITGPPSAIEAAIKVLRQWAAKEVSGTGSASSEQSRSTSVSQYIAVELNLSCPNIKANDAPSGYDAAAITDFIVAAQKANAEASLTNVPQLAVGLKLPPYIFPAQFKHILKALESVQIGNVNSPHHPIRFLTSTNTLGGSFWLNEGEKTGDLNKALPTNHVSASGPGTATLEDTFDGTGGLAGESLHPISLGNVYKLRGLLDSSSDARLRSISIIGVGGIMSGLSAQRMVKAGASNTVGLATAFGREGVDTFERISNEILDYAGFDEEDED